MASFYPNYTGGGGGEEIGIGNLSILETSQNKRAFNTTLAKLTKQDKEDDFLSSMLALHYNFIKTLNSMPSSFNIFKVIGEWISHLNNSLQTERYQESKISYENLLKIQSIIQRELDTWDLLLRLFYYGFSSHNPIDDNSLPYVDLFHLNEFPLVKHLTTTDNLLQEMEIIITWLERMYERNEEPDIRRQNINWENTLYSLKKNKAMGGKNTGTLVTKFDPDALFRENSAELHPLDSEENKRTQKGAFHYLRCGDKSKAMAYLNESGHFVKSIMLCGGDFTDRNEDTEGAKGKSLDGNPNRDFWKNTSFQVCDSENLLDYERACLGAVCGHKESLLNVAKTWEDKLWAHIKVSYDIRLETEIRSRSTAEYMEMPDEYWTQATSLDESLNQIESKDEFSQINSFFRKAQRFIILHQIQELIAYINDNLSDILEKNSDLPLASEQIIRFLVHILHVFEVLDLGRNSELMNFIYEKYIKILVDCGQILYIPFYVQKLSLDKQIPIMAHHISTSNPLTPEDIDCILKSAFVNDLDVLSIGVKVVENLIQIQEDFEVESLLWILSAYEYVSDPKFVHLQYLMHSLYVSRKYLILENNQKVKAILSRISTECLEDVLSISSEYETYIREMACYKIYIEADDALTKWSKALSQKPSLNEFPNYIPEGSTISDRKIMEKNKKDFAILYAKWEKAFDYHTRTTITKFFEVLNFPSGWLCDCKNNINSEAFEQSLFQIERVRRIVIPKITYILMRLLKEKKSSNLIREFVYILCDDKKQMLKEFSKSEIGTIMKFVEEFTRNNSENLLVLS